MPRLSSLIRAYCIPKSDHKNAKVAACRSMSTCKSSPFLGTKENNNPNFDKMPTEPSRILAAHTQTLRRVQKACDSILTW